MLPEYGFGRCGGVCDGMPASQGYFLNQRVNTSARVETEVCAFVAVCMWIRDGGCLSSVGHFAVPDRVLRVASG